MHLKSLKVFCDVVGWRSFSRAADENGISQSGASQLVHHLEEYLGVRLIDRSKRPFVLTPEGQAYYDGCQKLVRRLYSLEEEVRSLHQEVAGRVTVASIYSVGLSHMSRFVQDFLRQHPKANVHLQYQHPERVYELVRNDRADVGLVSYALETRSIQVTPWRDEPMVFVCAPSNPYAERASLAITDLEGTPFVGFDERLRIRAELDKALATRGVEVRVVMEFDNIETLKRAVEIDAGVTLLPLPTVTAEVEAGTLIARSLSDVELYRPLSIIQRRGAELGRTARRFIELLRQASDVDRPTKPAAETAVAVEERSSEAVAKRRPKQSVAR